MRADVSCGLKCADADGHGQARPNVVAQRDGAQEALAVDVELLARRKSRWYDGSARMRFRRRMRIVGFVRMGQHGVGQRGFHRTADHVRRGYGCSFLRGVRTCKLDRKPAGREFDAGDHGCERVQDMLFRFLQRFFR